MEVTKKPYELLIRWDQDGTLAGAHVAYRYVIQDGGAVVGDREGAAEPLTIDAAPGFPLGDLLTQAQIDALTAKATADAQREAALADRDAALARVAELEAQLTAMQPAQE